MTRATSFAAGVVSLLAAAVPALAAAPEAVVWIEAERPAACNFEHFEESSMGKPKLLSDGLWIMKGMDQNDVQKLVPDEGILLKYQAQVDRPGKYDLWARIGRYQARADFQWRIGTGPWHDVAKTYPTTNLMELGFFCEVSWTNLGEFDLRPGETALEIRYPKATGQNVRMLVALDCFSLVQGKFVPEGP